MVMLLLLMMAGNPLHRRLVDIGAPHHTLSLRVIGRTMRMDDDDYVDNDIHLLIMKMIS